MHSARRPSSSTSAIVTTSPPDFVVADHDYVERLVEDDLLALAERLDVELRVQRHAHLAPAREDVDRAVLVGLQVGAVGGRGLRELLDFFTQRGDVLLGLLQA